MTFLFLRFYFCVLATLAIAWGIQSYSASQIEDKNFEVVKNVYAGQIRLVNYLVSQSSNRNEAVEKIRPIFKFGLSFVNKDDVKEKVEDEMVFFGKEDGVRVISELPTQDGYVVYGPLPELHQPSRSTMIFGLGIVLLLAAVGIALLLRPVAHQLRVVEKTAMAIADGEWNARIDETKVGSAKGMAKSFNLMAEKTSKLLASQRELLQCVSHELRTPISKLRFGIDLIKNAKSETEVAGRLTKMELATDELQMLIDELLGYVKLDSMDATIKLEECNLQEIIERQFADFQPLHENVSFAFQSSNELENLTIEADRMMLERVFANLITNAARFARSRVLVSVSDANEMVKISIEDDGCGLEESERERVFEPFVCAHAEKSRTGLGLTIVKKIVEHHDSVVKISESQWGGCRVGILWGAAKPLAPV